MHRSIRGLATPRAKHAPTPRNGKSGGASAIIERKLAELRTRLAAVDRLIAALEQSAPYSREAERAEQNQKDG